MLHGQLGSEDTRVVVLDDDPTGTQAAAGVPVLLTVDGSVLRETLRRNRAAYVQTNSRALDQRAAVELAREVREAALVVCSSLGCDVRFVLRGDSTLRGHVFAEVDVFCRPDSVVLFAPAFPAGGRTTVDGVQRVRIDARDVDAVDTEFARDPVFGYRSRTIVDYVAEVGDGRVATTIPLSAIRAGGSAAVAAELMAASPGAVVVPDAVTDDDLDAVFGGLCLAWQGGRDVVVRCAAPLAALCAGAMSRGFLAVPPKGIGRPALVVCGSHTAATTSQLAQLSAAGHPALVINTDRAMGDPRAEASRVAADARQILQRRGVAVIATERSRRADHGTLAHGAAVMTVVTQVVHILAEHLGTVVAKGGITSAAVATDGLGARRAWVRGQLLPGVSLWDLEVVSGTVPYVVVPGNVGGPDTLVQLLRLLEVVR